MRVSQCLTLYYILTLVEKKKRTRISAFFFLMLEILVGKIIGREFPCQQTESTADLPCCTFGEMPYGVRTLDSLNGCHLGPPHFRGVSSQIYQTITKMKRKKICNVFRAMFVISTVLCWGLRRVHCIQEDFLPLKRISDNPIKHARVHISLPWMR